MSESPREPLVCCICQLPIVHPEKEHYLGNSSVPVAFGRCCDTCDWAVVIPARINMTLKPKRKMEEAKKKQAQLATFKKALASPSPSQAVDSFKTS